MVRIIIKQVMCNVRFTTQGKIVVCYRQCKLCFPKHHTLITVLESRMFNVSETESVTKPRLSLLRQAGRQYAEHGKIESELLEQVNGTLYVGFKFSGFFGIFETGDFDISIPTDGTVKEIVIKTKDSEYLINITEVTD